MDLYNRSNKKEKMVKDMGGLGEDEQRWGDFGIMEGMYDVLSGRLQELHKLLEEFGPFKEDKDKIVWQLEPIKEFMVKSGHDLICEKLDSEEQEKGKSEAFEKIWKVHVLLRIRVFGWRVFLNMIASKDQLFRRCILTSTTDMSCVLCIQVSENMEHIFFEYQVAKRVWQKMEDWLDISLRREGLSWRFFLHSSRELRKKNIKKGKEGVVWLAVVWCIWNHNNEILFKETSCNVSNLVWSIKLKMWKWFLIGDIPNSNCNFYDFRKDLINYLA